MILLFYWCVVTLTHAVVTQTTDKYTDENRPYKFGFNIQGYQHRKEEKDEKGIIKGEYGFITADGYYRVTIYATDENGDFKIISMKNYYVGFPPENPTTLQPPPPKQPTKTINNQQQNPNQLNTDFRKRKPNLSLLTTTRITPSTYQTTTTKRPVSIQGQAGCSHCFIPTTTAKTPNGAARVDYRLNLNNLTDKENKPNQINEGLTEKSRNNPGTKIGSQLGFSEEPKNPFNTPEKHEVPQIGSRLGFSEEPKNAPVNEKHEKPIIEPNRPNPKDNIHGNLNILKRDDEAKPKTQGITRGKDEISNRAKSKDEISSRNQLENQKPTDRSSNKPPQPEKTDKPLPGEVRDGLPKGITKDDIKNLLYTFNYTVGFHGHHEDGYRNGDKKGDYFFDGRDGVERNVKYIANEFGYQPNITLIDLDENDVRKPNEKTEKEFGLKGYEFKWFFKK